MNYPSAVGRTTVHRTCFAIVLCEVSEWNYRRCSHAAWSSLVKTRMCRVYQVAQNIGVLIERVRFRRPRRRPNVTDPGDCYELGIAGVRGRVEGGNTILPEPLQKVERVARKPWMIWEENLGRGVHDNHRGYC